MEYVYGAMLLHSAGKEISEDNLKKVLDAAGIDVDDARVKVLTSSLADVSIDEVIAQASMAPAAAPAAPAAAAAKEEEKEEEAEEKEEEVSEEEVEEGLGALFG
ncbi:MAG TPA: 50S ribosomal protein P1 [Thermoplasmatales archaeon]|nr:50S ribosomal protein P1 [Candidatus Thermoplasmatota archaeon]MDD5777989.1 50S ribosomal protein P1 [Candidatus Thermoplasmatota archaeon]HDS59053.1 50S ribosomal protein P1 [Thermoplasmatales archaeon]